VLNGDGDGCDGPIVAPRDERCKIAHERCLVVDLPASPQQVRSIILQV
jgi:hypothetical protein